MPWIGPLFLVFGLSSWLAINSAFAQTPLFAQTLPESYSIANTLIFCMQGANVVPFAWMVYRNRFRSRHERQAVCNEVVLIWILLALAVGSCILMAFIWDITIGESGDPDSKNGTLTSNSTAQDGVSVGAIVGFSVMGVVDCTTSVVYWPFTQQFPQSMRLVPWLATGEALTGLVTAVLAAIQTSKGSSADDVLFSTRTYFGLIAGLSACSALAFHFIRRHQMTQPSEASRLVEESVSSTDSAFRANAQNDPTTSIIEDVHDQLLVNGNAQLPSEATHGPPSVAPALWTKIELLVCIAVMNALQNGLLPSVIPFATKPYGDGAYQWAIYVALICASLACLTTQWIVVATTLIRIGGALVVALAVLMCVLASGHTPSTGSSAMAALIVIGIGLLSALLAYVKTVAFLHLHEPSEGRKERYVWGGACIQIGSLIGAMLTYLLIHNSSVFRVQY